MIIYDVEDFEHQELKEILEDFHVHAMNQRPTSADPLILEDMLCISHIVELDDGCLIFIREPNILKSSVVDEQDFPILGQHNGFMIFNNYALFIHWNITQSDTYRTLKMLEKMQADKVPVDIIIRKGKTSKFAAVVSGRSKYSLGRSLSDEEVNQLKQLMWDCVAGFEEDLHQYTKIRNYSLVLRTKRNSSS